MRRLRWDPPGEDRALPKHPYRDAALVYGAMAAVIVAVAAVTGGDLKKAVLVAAGLFVVATAWSWRTFRNRLRQQEAADREKLL